MTGRLWEYDFCGKVVDWFKESIKYKSWRVCVNEITQAFSKNENPHWDVSDPNGICSDLFYYVAKALKVECMCDLKCFPAFGTSFDIFHGVDLFFVYQDRIVTVDLTINNNKDQYKANVLITPETDLEWMGETIAKRLN